MRRESATGGRRVAAIASRQHGVVTVSQLRESGFDEAAVRRRVASGQLHRVFRGVYAVGHRSLSWRGRWLAAVLAAGDGAVLSHTSAVALWQFLRPMPGPIHVTVSGDGGRKKRPGLRIHRSSTLAPRDITRRHGIVVTTPARTIDDIRGEVEPYLFRRALRQAELAGYRVPRLGRVKRTRSDLELLFLGLSDDHELPRPVVNRRRASDSPSDGEARDLSVVTGDGRPVLAQASVWPARTQTRRRGSATSSGRGRRRARRGPAREVDRRPARHG